MSKLKTLKNLKIKNPYRTEKLSVIFEDGVFHAKKEVRTELGFKRIVKLQNEKEFAVEHYAPILSGKIEEIMDLFNITKEDIEKFKEEMK